MSVLLGRTHQTKTEATYEYAQPSVDVISSAPKSYQYPKKCAENNIRIIIANAKANFSKNFNLSGVKISGLFQGMIYFMI